RRGGRAVALRQRDPGGRAEAMGRRPRVGVVLGGSGRTEGGTSAFTPRRPRKGRCPVSAPERNAECPFCLEVRPLLMPVRFCAGTLEVQEVPLCAECRVGWQDDEYACLASTIEHAR